MGNRISEEEIKSKKYGRLTPIEIIGKSSNGGYVWKCKCDCGKFTNVQQSRLRNGGTVSCGCYGKERQKESSTKDIKGKRFGKLVAVEKTNKKKNNCYIWKCLCDCGNEIEVSVNYLLKGGKKSCGCLQGYNLKKHGDTGTRLHNIWRGLLARCGNSNVRCYERYGGRGITVCDEWKGEKGFDNFKKWALENDYAENLTIDRKDVNGNYCPENCKWSTTKEQCNNTRRNVKITYNGKEQTIAQWSEETGIKYMTLYRRIKAGWSAEKALTTYI